VNDEPVLKELPLVDGQLSPDAVSRPGQTGTNWTADILSGFLVFLIALPLCLAISLASGCPATAGVFTAIVGGLISPWISNSALTIKGPAAGLIVIVLGCVVDFGGGDKASPEAQMQAYKLMLGVAVVAGAIQVGLALIRSGVLAEIFPTSAVHGMLAAIGVIIFSKQFHIMLGVKPIAKEPLHLLAEIPHSITLANPQITIIGLISLAVLFGWGFMPKTIRKVPAQLIVLIFGMGMALYFDLDHLHTYTFSGHKFEIGEQFLVNVPASIFAAITLPDFSGVMTVHGAKWILMFTLIGTLESLLSSKAVDLLDPQRRKTNQNRDLLAVGVGNAVVGMIGGTPMISEIVRSKANIDNGAKSRFANMFHGMFLLLFVALLPWLIHRIPLAALAAMLVYTGCRLAHYREFVHMLKVGYEQLFVFSVTLVAVLATDLLIGVAIGFVLELALNWWHGMTPHSVINPAITVDEPDPYTTRVYVNNAAVFTNWLALRKQVLAIDPDRTVMLDFSQAQLVDHNVMEKLEQLQDDLTEEGRNLLVIGLRGHTRLSSHRLAGRKRHSAP
jgi:MFS superfamily sulfate permease-like transporter